MSNPQSDMAEFNERVYRALKDQIDDLASCGALISADEILEAAARPVLDRFAADVAANVTERQPGLIRDMQRTRQGFTRRLRKYWGDALDSYYAIAVCLEELGSDFNDLHRASAAESNDLVFEALTGLHARACRTALEVHHLLSGGFPMGALARCRTLHELAVTAGVIQKYGRQPNHHELAERYLLHDYVDNWKDAFEYQKHCEDIGYSPFTDEEMAEFKASRDAVVGRFGTPFKEQYGWAVNLVDNGRMDFRRLEDLADLSHLRGYYKWASHEIHADAKGWRLNRGERGGKFYILLAMLTMA